MNLWNHLERSRPVVLIGVGPASSGLTQTSRKRVIYWKKHHPLEEILCCQTQLIEMNRCHEATMSGGGRHALKIIQHESSSSTLTYCRP